MFDLAIESVLNEAYKTSESLQQTMPIDLEKQKINFFELTNSQKVYDLYKQVIDEVQESFVLDDKIKIRQEFSTVANNGQTNVTYAYVPGVIGIQSNIDQVVKKPKKSKKSTSKSNSPPKQSAALSADKKSANVEIKEPVLTPKNISAPKSALPENIDLQKNQKTSSKSKSIAKS